MKNAALIMIGIGSMGFMIGAAGIDGSTSEACAILSVVSIGIIAVGNKIYKLAKEGERLERERARDARRTKDDTFGVWLQSGRMGM